VDWLHASGVRGWVRGDPFMVLLLDLLHFFLPWDPPASPLGPVLVRGDSELFLLILVAHWCDRNVILRKAHLLSTFSAPTYRRPAFVNGDLLEPMEYRPWNQYTLQCVYVLLAHVLGAPQYRHWSATASAVAAGSLAGGFGGGIEVDDAERQAVLMLEQPLFDMLVTALTVEVWLLWLQPWRAAQVYMHHHSSVMEAFSDFSQDALPMNVLRSLGHHDHFTSDWRAHVAANYHFYTSLSLLVMDVIASLELSATADAELSAILLHYLDATLQLLNNPHVSGLLRAAALAEPHAGELSAPERWRLEWHRTRLAHHTHGAGGGGSRHGFFVGNANVGQRLAQRLCSLRTDSPVGVAKIDELVKGVCDLFALSHADYTAAGQEPGGGWWRFALGVLREVSPFDLRNLPPPPGPRRGKDGELTEEGRLEVLSGQRRVVDASLAYRVDVLRRPVASSEVPWLARRLSRLSVAANSALGLPLSPALTGVPWGYDLLGRMCAEPFLLVQSFRVNLRPLAHRRVLLLAVFVAVLLLSEMHVAPASLARQFRELVGLVGSAALQLASLLSNAWFWVVVLVLCCCLCTGAGDDMLAP